MLILPAALLSLLVEFVPLCFRPVWKHAQVLLVGALLAPGKHTVTACLRVMGLSQETRCVHYHRLLNRARWSGPDRELHLAALVGHDLCPSRHTSLRS
jgi:hypothetical protein